MSSTYFKVAVRAPLTIEFPHLRAALNYFRERLGEPDELDLDNDEDNDDDFYFYYKPTSHHYTPIPGYRDKRWGIEHILEYAELGRDKRVQLNIVQLQQIVDDLVRTFNVDPQTVSIHCYNWYNGGDEPVYF